MKRAVETMGKFLYQAVAIPRGHRNPKRVNLRGDAAYSIRTIDAADAVPDAVRVKVGRSEQWDGYLGHAGRLWKPLPNLNAMTRGAPATFEMLKRCLGDLYKADDDGLPEDHPIKLRFDSRYGPGTALRPEEVADESEFQGKVLRSNRAASLRSHTAAVEHYLCVDGIAHAAAYEPLWSANRKTNKVKLIVPGIGVAENDFGRITGAILPMRMFQGFRLDRQKDAIAWCAAVNSAKPFELEGEAEVRHGEFLRRDDLIETISDRLPGILDDLHPALRWLPSGSAGRWEMLRGFVAAGTPEDSGLLPAGRDDALLALTALSAACEGLLLPADVDKRAAMAVRDIAEITSRRDFELGLGRGLDSADHEALAAFSPVPA